ncbi:universal stress protein [Cupriavidus sp. 30B13]|uniref:universal stress protein n=1 Tax=Cupriavidus sp. 30B13 TaxID=3384241 RepID=UPI003B91A06D
MYEKILLAVDGSRSSDLALSQAIIVAKATGSEVKALFVADDTDVFYFAGTTYPSWLMDNIRKMGEETLDAAARRLAEAGVRHSTKLIENPVSPGLIAETIVREADGWGADLIVMGTHGRRGVKRLVLGSVAEGVVRESSKPVLLIRSEIKE